MQNMFISIELFRWIDRCYNYVFESFYLMLVLLNGVLGFLCGIVVDSSEAVFCDVQCSTL